MKIFSRIITGTALCAAMMAPALISAAATPADNSLKRDPDSRVVYSIYLRNYTNPDAAGTFKDLEADLPRLKELGIDVIHLLPFYEMGVEHAKGSPYCIKDYTKVDPRYGTLEDLKSLISALHANGMEIWFDMVANHTAYDNPWVKEHPEWYTERQDFDDVRSVNSSSKDLRRAMADAMKYWVEECGIDGFRCDFAHAPGRDFWVDIVEMVDPDHKLYWLGEGDEGGIANDWVRGEGGPFDSRYGWTYAEYLYKDANNRKDQTVKGDFDQAMFHLGYPEKRATFLTYIGSHDIYQGMKPRVSANTQDVIYGDNLKPITVMTMLAPGVPMVYMGQEINFSQPGGVGIMTDNEAVDWSRVDEDYLSLVKSLIRLRHEQPALHTGKGILVNHATDNDSVYVFERRYGDESVIAAVNFSHNPQAFTITSPTVPANMYKDAATSDAQQFYTGARLTLPGKAYAIYTKEPGELIAGEYTITATVPEGNWSSAPVLRITTPDPLGTGGALAVVDSKPMTASGNGTYTFSVPYLPDFGYDVAFINPATGAETSPIHEEHARSAKYGIAADGTAARK